MAIEWIKFGKPSLVGAVTGTIAGLAAITPASGFVGPEAAVGGPIALLRNGDMITLDGNTGEMSVALSDEQLAARRAEWKPRQNDFQSGALWKFAQLVGDAEKGAVTHPGAAAETHIYADI